MPVLFTEERKEVSSPFILCGKTDVVGKLRISVSSFRNSMGEAFIIFHFASSMSGRFSRSQETVCSFAGANAGRVKHQSAGTEHIGCLEDKLFLDFGKLHGFFGESSSARVFPM